MPGVSARIVVAGLIVAAALAVPGCGPVRQDAAGSPSAGPTRSAAPARPTATPSGTAFTGPYDPARFAPSVLRESRRAGINPQLLMAILYNESYKPHDPALERAWQRIKPDAAFGIANMHQAAFDDAKRGRDFADRQWTELPDDPDLAIEAAAWYLHDLSRALPGSWVAGYTRDELLALGYNAGAGSMAAFARGTRPGTVARSYLDKLRANWAKAGKVLSGVN